MSISCFQIETSFLTQQWAIFVMYFVLFTSIKTGKNYLYKNVCIFPKGDCELKWAMTPFFISFLYLVYTVIYRKKIAKDFIQNKNKI